MRTSPLIVAGSLGASTLTARLTTLTDGLLSEHEGAIIINPRQSGTWLGLEEIDRIPEDFFKVEDKTFRLTEEARGLVTPPQPPILKREPAITNSNRRRFTKGAFGKRKRNPRP